ncbi:methyltransferase domain-containing protein [Thiolinea disciformis]|uniref:methyltransferase domain-containing protein n=1 Tax=Thiolinea disciformis TaxID=125614 RepID=UPI0003812D28|nr:methyltransferase domain-containing protein [Thiolinea disciformis]
MLKRKFTDKLIKPSSLQQLVPAKRRSNLAVMSDLQRWYSTRQGAYALAEVQQVIQRMTADVFGYYALEIGWLNEQCEFLKESRISRHWRMPASNSELAYADLVADPEALPIGFDMVDLVVGFHVLEYAYSPHQVLREIDRILMPEGHCILVAFNPFSMRGLNLSWKRLRSDVGAGPSSPAVYTNSRIRDWFDLLGFEHLETQQIGFRPRLNQGLFQRSTWLEELGGRYQPALGNLQVIHVRKQVMRPIRSKPRFRARPLLQPSIVVNSTPSRLRHLKVR